MTFFGFLRTPAHTRASPGDGRTAVGVFCLVAAIYALTASGRMDSIDGQHRYEVAHNILTQGAPVIEDRVLVLLSSIGIDGRHYSYYGIGASALGLPLVALGRLLGDAETEQFFFSWTSSFAGAALCAAYYVVLRRLDITRAKALAWTFVLAFASLLWSVSVTVFDQTQHALVLFLATVSVASASQRSSPIRAAGAGALAGSITLWQPAYGLVALALGLPLVFDPSTQPGQRWATLKSRTFRLLPAFLLGLLVPALSVGAYNAARFGSPFELGSVVPRTIYPPMLGNPVTGTLILLASPGKSIFLYSPTVILALLGFRGLWRRSTALGIGILSVTIVQFALVASLGFPSGDWCWGPRYLAVSLPLISLGMPFVSLAGMRRWLAGTLIAASFAVQVLGNSLDYHRFFFERGFMAVFWRNDPWVYFRESQLFARPDELLRSAKADWGRRATHFRGPPFTYSPTYAVFGPKQELRFRDSPWILDHAVIQLPRPWPFWVSHLPSHERPTDVPLTLGALAVLAASGLWLLSPLRMLRRERDPSA